MHLRRIHYSGVGRITVFSSNVPPVLHGPVDLVSLSALIWGIWCRNYLAKYGVQWTHQGQLSQSMSESCRNVSQTFSPVLKIMLQLLWLLKLVD